MKENGDAGGTGWVAASVLAVFAAALVWSFLSEWLAAPLYFEEHQEQETQHIRLIEDDSTAN